MEIVQGKHFSITDQKGVTTVIYQVNKTEKEFLENSPKYTVQRLDSTAEIRGENTRRTYYIDIPSEIQDELLFLSFGKDKVVVNTGMLKENKVYIGKRPTSVRFDTLYYEEETEYKEFVYTPNFKRPISIIDPETTEEVKPVLYMDENTNEVKGKCKLKPKKPYFFFEIRDNNRSEVNE